MKHSELVKRSKRVYTDYEVVIEGIELKLERLESEVGEPEIVLDVAGTNPRSITDIITDIRAVGIRYEDDIGFVAAGFWDVSTDVFKWLVTELDKDEIPNLTVNGHSLGGAVSIYLVAQLIESWRRLRRPGPRPFKECVTFGAPRRIGRLKILDVWSHQIACYERRGDTVVVAPLPHRKPQVPRYPIGQRVNRWPLSIDNHDMTMYIGAVL